jgi:hypothetical protein
MPEAEAKTSVGESATVAEARSTADAMRPAEVLESAAVVNATAGEAGARVAATDHALSAMAPETASDMAAEMATAVSSAAMAAVLRQSGLRPERDRNDEKSGCDRNRYAKHTALLGRA